MSRYVAFLRAVNVGGHTVTMDRIRAVFEEAGMDDVATFIASGNVIFTTRARNLETLERRLATHLHAALGFAVVTFVRTLDDVARILAAVPFAERDVAAAHAVMVALLADAPDQVAMKRVGQLAGPSDEFRLADRELYWLRRSRESDPGLGRDLEKAVGAPITVRNVNTLRRLLARFGDPLPE